MNQPHTATYFQVVRDQGHGRVYNRVGYETEAEALAAMRVWQREGLAGAHPSLIGGGEWRIEPVRRAPLPNGGAYFERSES